MTRPAFTVSREHRARVNAIPQQDSELPQLPLLRLGASGQLVVTLHHRHTFVPPNLLAKSAQPSIIILGDDDTTPTGPSGWPQAEQLLGWAPMIFLHGTGGEPEHYMMAAASAFLFGRVLFVETTSRHLEDWTLLADRCSSPGALIQLVTTFPGRTHPMRGRPDGSSLQ